MLKIYLSNVVFKNKSCLIGEIYRRPNTNEDEFINFITSVSEYAASEKSNLIIGTDQNINLLRTENSKVKRLLEVTYEQGIIPCITKPTRVTKSSATLIDQIYVNGELFRNMTSNIVLCDTSDHWPCAVNLKITAHRPFESKTITGRQTSDVKINELNRYLNCYQWDNLNMFDVDTAYDMFMNVLKTGLDNIMPKQTKNHPCQ